MAFQSAEESNVTNFGPRGARNDSWKADAFINIYMPTKGGKSRKLGSIGLKSNRPADKKLIDWLKEDPSRIGQLMQVAEVDFRMAEGSEDSEFLLPGEEPDSPASTPADSPFND